MEANSKVTFFMSSYESYNDVPPEEGERTVKPRQRHYYGDIVRILFVVGALLMAFMLPVFNELIHLPTILSLAGIIFIGLMAGFTAPKRTWVAWVNVGIAAVVVFFAENSAIQAFSHYREDNQFLFFWLNQVVVLIFFVALYYSVKTLRGMLLK